ncbi:MotA/TolQ/ExbB proton channel family protein [Bordetella genomosp. 9]|uniref:Biopolymer transport protein ExbB n=1 Tax=Bordetella genomosp. 9 TaxID=1416803 RepID=A0A1W6YYY4_9BORD|nr:MotA/TolQ/ExbB proton channel family protein [Bordetella genomosp. 9]ARP86201.1 flagellar motor protein MotA [Bordetella genomosp. 9]ARP90222.1 flagellar motor protein MotA [Bordetella genomosp. 9]
MSIAHHIAMVLAQAMPAAPADAGAGPAAAQAPAAVGEAAGNALQGAAPLPAPDMGIMHFVAQSDIVGKTLFVILILMSLVTWYLILVKAGHSMVIRSRSRDFLNKFWNAGSLEQVEHEIATHGARDPFSHLAAHAMHAQAHHAKYGATKLAEAGSNGEFVTRTMRKVIDEETAKLENGLTVLASVGSTAPFVGLFGTVWGVYHALVGIGLADGVTINRIAGPVGEALIMTGLGLAVAIPAVLAYNAFVRKNRVFLSRLDAFAHDLFAFLTTGQQVAVSDSKVRAMRRTGAVNGVNGVRGSE